MTTARNDFYGYTVTTITNTWQPAPERPPFLVDGILHSSMTLLYGEAKIGKSTFAAAIAASMANGEAVFLGRRIEPARYSVGIIAGDFGDDQAYGAQLRQVLGDGAEVSAYSLDRPPDRRVWEGLQLAARERGHRLMIVDNLTSFVDGSLNDDQAVNQFYDELDRFVRDGAAVLLIAHSSEKYGERGKSPYPLGSSAVRARARWTCRAEKRREGLRLSFEGNHDAPHQMTVTPAAGVPRFTLLDAATAAELSEATETRRRLRSEKRLDQNGEVAEFIATELQGISNVSEVARRVNERFDRISVETARRHIGKGDNSPYPVRHDGSGNWTLAA